MTIYITRWLYMCIMILFLDVISKRWGEVSEVSLVFYLDISFMNSKCMLLFLGKTKGCGLYIEVSWANSDSDMNYGAFHWHVFHG